MARGALQQASRGGRSARERQFQHELLLARIAAGDQPNRTPGPLFLQSRGIPSGVASPFNPSSDFFGNFIGLSNSFRDFFENGFPRRRTPDAKPQIKPKPKPPRISGSPLNTNPPPALGRSGIRSDLRNFLKDTGNG